MVVGDGALRSVKRLRRMMVQASDAYAGRVEQVFFDDLGWGIRYIVVRTDKSHGSRRVLVPPADVAGIDYAACTVLLSISAAEVAAGPDVDSDMPVCRQKEVEVNRTLVLAPHWGGVGTAGVGWIPPVLMDVEDAAEGSWGRTHDAHLRSSREVLGYRLRAGDTDIGRVEDLLFPDGEWRILYVQAACGRLAARVRRWFSTILVESVQWREREVVVDLPPQVMWPDPARSGHEHPPH